MHEMSLAEGVRSIVEEASSEEGFGRVSLIVLEVGELAAVEVDALRFCLDAVLEGSLAAGAAVDIQMVAGAGWCGVCLATVPLHQRYDPCPQCGAYGVKPTGGLAMRVKELEVA